MAVFSPTRLLILVAVAAAALGASVSRLDGFLQIDRYTSAACAEAGPSAFVQEPLGVCVKIFEGPEDPTTEVPSQKTEVISADGETINVSKQVYSDSACSKANGDAEKTTYSINKCVTPAGMVVQNVTKDLAPPSPELSGGWSITGYQEPTTCSSAKSATWNAVFVNDACFPIAGTTSKKQHFSSFSGHCSGNQFVQSFYSDAACAAAIPNSDLVVKTGTADTTCFINYNPSFDYNLFQTMVCVGGKSEQRVASTGATLASVKDLFFHKPSL